MTHYPCQNVIIYAKRADSGDSPKFFTPKTGGKMYVASTIAGKCFWKVFLPFVKNLSRKVYLLRALFQTTLADLNVIMMLTF